MKEMIRVATERFTKHARERGDKRAIGQAAVSAAVTYGGLYKAGSRDRVYWLDRESLRLCSGDSVSLERYTGVAVIMMKDGSIKTLMRCYRRPRHWEKIA